MNCRDIRGVADSFLSEQLPAETNHEVLRHLETCPSCRTEIDARRRLRGALRTAFNRSTELQPAAGFTKFLRDQLRDAAAHRRRSWTSSSRWLAAAAGFVLAVGATTATMVFNRAFAPTEQLARDAIGDHRNCALKYRLVRTPMPLEEAAQRFDSAYRVLLSAPPDDLSTPDGAARVVERHACAYGGRRFGHVIIQYRGRVVSLLVTANNRTTDDAESRRAIPHVIGRPVEGLSVVSVDGSRHVVMLVSDLEEHEFTQLARNVSLPLVERLADVGSDRMNPFAWLIVPPIREMRSYSVLGLTDACARVNVWAMPTTANEHWNVQRHRARLLRVSSDCPSKPESRRSHQEEGRRGGASEA